MKPLIISTGRAADGWDFGENASMVVTASRAISISVAPVIVPLIVAPVVVVPLIVAPVIVPMILVSALVIFPVFFLVFDLFGIVVSW